jgi:TetR/AcrR family transcriptional repressor of bet genes
LVNQLIMPRPRNTDARRAQIVAALATVMAERGYEGASIQRIARAAGLTPGLVHYHFESKQQILLSLVAQLVAGARSRIESRLARAQSARGRVTAFVEALLAVGDDGDPAAVATWALVGAEAVRQGDVREAYRAWLDEARSELVELLREVYREEGRRTRNLEAAAMGILCTVEGYYAVAAAAPGVIPPGSAASTTRRMLEGLLP